MTVEHDPAWNAHLLPHHANLIEASKVSPAVAAARGYRTVTTKADLKRLGFSDSQCRVPALLIPIHDVFGEIVNYQLRPDTPRVARNGKPCKYETVAGSVMALDVPPAARARLGDPRVPLVITEGARKADAAVSAGLWCIDVLGVWNWRGTNTQGGKTALPDFEQIALNDRIVYLVFDSDIMTKQAVHAALVRLKAFLELRGARVFIIYLPGGESGAKVGLDDYLATGHSVDDLLARASSTPRQPVADESGPDVPYVATPSGLIWHKPTQNGSIAVPLANFSARIVADVVEDDGAEERRVYEIEATRGDRTYAVTIPAAQFPGMGWVPDRLGASANVSPGMGLKDHLRHAIQALSHDIPERRVFTHTGWRQVDDTWFYLHAAGAIGPDGLVTTITVALRGPLARFSLPAPADGDDGVTAVRAILSLLDLLPLEIVVPLVGAALLAPLRELLGDEAPDFVVWLHGPSGTFKSELAPLVQAFFGDFSRQTLPVSFAATANAIERFTFEAKDALLVVDDFHPAGDPREAQAMNQVANRLLRGAGNAAGRARMRADTSLRPALSPRCVAIASGERLPEGHSTVARTYPVAVEPNRVDPRNLAEAQEQRQQFPLAMAGYLQQLAVDFEPLRATLPDRFRALRREIQLDQSHRREPGQVAHLLLGLEVFLDYAVERGALTAAERDEHLLAAREVLLAHAREHGAAQAEEAPEQRFLQLLGDGFASKRAYLESKRGGHPADPKRWGWETVTRPDQDGIEQDEHRHLSVAQLVGVLDGDWLLLFPEATYQFVAAAARAAGRVFPVDERTLVRRLAEAGLIAVETEGEQRRRKVNVWINGTSRRVIKLHRDALDGSASARDREEWEEREGREERGRHSDLPPATDHDAAEIPLSAQTSADKRTNDSGAVDDHGQPAPRPARLPTLPGCGEEEADDMTNVAEMVEWRA